MKWPAVHRRPIQGGNSTSVKQQVDCSTEATVRPDDGGDARMRCRPYAMTRRLPLRVLMPLFIAIGSIFFGTSQSAGQKSFESATRRPRAADLGLRFGVLARGPMNSITDVTGVQVGHCTVVEGKAIRTGVTVIMPHRGNLFQQKVPAAVWIGNGFGKLVGISQVQELGVLETPIVLTNTLSTFAMADALVAWTLQQSGNEAVQSVNPVVGECNDGYLNDIRRQFLNEDHLLAAINSADSRFEEGSVGAGTGMRCMGFKGGIGTSSRLLPKSLGGWTIGVLVQSNFGGCLRVAGAPVGERLNRCYLAPEAGEGPSRDQTMEKPELGSCMIVIATDAPLDSRQLQRLAKRALLGLGAVGSPMTHGSGDYVIAFSTDKHSRRLYQDKKSVQSRPSIRDDSISPLFQGVKDATEESVINSLLRATTVTGQLGRRMEAIDIQQLLEICRKHGVITD